MPARAAYKMYTVVAGDTLAKIANRAGSTVAAIAAASGVVDVNKIRVGQVLSIPTLSTQTYDPADLDLMEVQVNLKNTRDYVPSTPGPQVPAPAAPSPSLAQNPLLWVAGGLALAFAVILFSKR